MMKIKPVIFPEDGGPHKCIVEWWYYNGFLETEDGHRFAYMFCLFKVDNKKVQIPLLSRLPVKTVYFSHALLSDIGRQKFDPHVDYFSSISKDSFKRDLLYVNFLNPLDGPAKYVNSEIEERPGHGFHLKRENFDLELVSTKSPLLEGGTGYVKLHDKSTYYYSLTNLQTTGKIFVNGKELAVTGKSWMDHQWADTKYSDGHWTWFSLQLDNDFEMVCFRYGNDKRKDYLATWIDAEGVQGHTSEVILTPLDGGWKSKKTKNVYNLVWRIEVPSKQIVLEVEPEIIGQEMLFGAINYWEGPLKVKGTVTGRKVAGQGFLELVANPLEYGALKMMSKMFQNIKRKIF